MSFNEYADNDKKIKFCFCIVPGGNFMPLINFKHTDLMKQAFPLSLHKHDDGTLLHYIELFTCKRGRHAK